MSRVLGVIPARLGSTRLPRKPLQPLLGTPLIGWVWDRVRQFTSLDRVVVATDAPEVRDLCSQWGAEVVLTSPDHPSGTDRVHEVVTGLEEDFSVVVNVQGDEPLVTADQVDRAVEMVKGGHDVGTCATAICGADEFADPAVVKVVRGSDGSALYFSRAAIPHPRDAGGRWSPGLGLRHVGIYAYSPGALRRWTQLDPSPLEEQERLEQLRALQGGLGIGVAVVDDAEGGVDTPADLARVEGRLRELGAHPPVHTEET
ncbi:MAG: 3-deoxy-manno-octulosonate cytidylyltransferase [Longimicrobiales bacterium]